MQPEIKNKLKQALTGKDTVEMGQFKWVNLEVVREEAGDDWDRLRQKIYSASGDFIERRLGEGDVLLRCQGGFMIIFGALEGAAAAEKVEEISLALNVFFLGDHVLRSLKVEAEARSISPEEFMQIVATSVPVESSGEYDPENRYDASEDFDSAPTEGVLAKWRNDDADSDAAIVAEREPEPRRLPARKPSKPRPGPGSPGWQDQEHKKAPDEQPSWQATEKAPPVDQDVNWQEGRPTFSRESLPKWEAARAETPAPKAKPTMMKIDGFVEPSAQWDEIVFKACWDSRPQAISINFAMARREYRGQVLFGRDTLLGNDSIELHRAMDRSVAIAAQRAFQVRHNQGINCMIAIPVHYDSIAKTSDRVSYFSLLQPIPKHVRKFFLLRVDGIPKGAPMSKMQELMRSMKGFGSKLLADVKFGDRDLRRFEGCGVDMFGTELPPAMSRRDPKDHEVMALAELASSARLLKAETFVAAADTFDSLEMALSTGVRFISGEAIGADLALPAAMQSLKLSEIRTQNDPEPDDDDVALI